MPVRIPRRSPWSVQYLVLKALLQREAVTRFGKYKMGLMWMLLEPLTSVIVLGLLLGPLVGRTAPDMPYAFFLLNGFMLLQTFTGPLTSGIGAIKSNQGLLVFPKVQPLDLLMARFLFELGTSLFSYTVFCLIGMWMGINISLDQIHIILATFIITWMAGSGLGLIFGVGAVHYQSVEKIVAFVKRPLLFLSCVLYPFYGLPKVAQDILLYNPLVHTIELSRKSLFPFYHVIGVNLTYPATFAIIVFAIGISFFHNHRHFLTQR